MTKEICKNPICGHDKEIHNDFEEEGNTECCAVLDERCKCKKFEPQNYSPQNSSLAGNPDNVIAGQGEKAEDTFDLSEKIWHPKGSYYQIIKTEDIKEFIRIENEIINDFLMDKISSGEMQIRRKKLAGGKLVE